MRRIEDGAHLPRPGLCMPVSADAADEGPPSGLDDRSLAFVLAARPVFDQIRALTGQLAGLLVLKASGARSAQDHPMFALVLDRHDRMRDGLAALDVPASADHHHRHLRRAAHAVTLAVQEARDSLHRGDEASLDAITAPLRRAQQELHWAAASLPGFAVVDLRQACCAAHSFALLPQTTRS
jgi:hypothetical protein